MKKRTISGTVFTIAIRLMGMICFVSGLRLMGTGVWNYIDQHRQTDWTFAAAEVVDLSSRVESSGRHHSSHTVYDITYQYEVNGNFYSDTLYNRSEPLLLGDTVSIKYDPDAPENSTDILAPDIGNLIVFLAAGAVFTVIGFFLSGLWALIGWIRRKGQPVEEEILPPEEYVRPEEVPADRLRNPAAALGIRIAVIVLALGALFLSFQFLPG